MRALRLRAIGIRIVRLWKARGKMGEPARLARVEVTNTRRSWVIEALSSTVRSMSYFAGCLVGWLESVFAVHPRQNHEYFELQTGTVRSVRELVPSVQHTRTETNKLIRDFASSTTPDEYKTLAAAILDRPHGPLAQSLPTLRRVLEHISNDDKRACVLQLLAELRDDESATRFVDEIHAFSQTPEDTPLPISVITAITYVRLLNIPAELLDQLLNDICIIARNRYAIQSVEDKQLIAGALVTVGVLGNLESSSAFIIELLRSADSEIVEEALDSLTAILNRSRKQPIRDDLHHQLGISLMSLLESQEAELARTTDESRITSSDIIVSQLLPLLARIDAPSATSAVLRVIMTALRSDDTYLKGSIVSAIRALPADLRPQLFEDLIKQHPLRIAAKAVDFMMA